MVHTTQTMVHTTHKLSNGHSGPVFFRRTTRIVALRFSGERLSAIGHTQPTARNMLGGVLAVWLLLLTTGIALLAGTGIRINLSGSLPLGFYRLTAAGIERGVLVAACPDMTIRRATSA